MEPCFCIFQLISPYKWKYIWLQGDNFKVRKVDGVKAMSKDSRAAVCDSDKQLLLGDGASTSARHPQATATASFTPLPH